MRILICHLTSFRGEAEGIRDYCNWGKILTIYTFLNLSGDRVSNIGVYPISKKVERSFMVLLEAFISQIIGGFFETKATFLNSTDSINLITATRSLQLTYPLLS